ncbi:putative RND superfamily exporter protein [Microbacterium resistens]|uniref:RND superfamily exporter protein n=1 Tax=Microbacterium resistens TaxID=156977 RepID=A0ABU1SEV7_9MICO|nr:hypothetical protein [Microbacterium resistens]MDR6868137.1 putative RND superfamily exporter protein [Microbacterium resistens]
MTASDSERAHPQREWLGILAFVVSGLVLFCVVVLGVTGIAFVAGGLYVVLPLLVALILGVLAICFSRPRWRGIAAVVMGGLPVVFLAVVLILAVIQSVG